MILIILIIERHGGRGVLRPGIRNSMDLSASVQILSVSFFRVGIIFFSIENDHNTYLIKYSMGA